MKVAVVGAGAVGSWLGGALAAGGAAVTLVARPAHGDAVARSGLELRKTGAANARARRVRVSVARTVAEAAARHGPFDVALLTVKSYDTEGATSELIAAGAPPCVASFQNGVGNEAAIAAALPGSAVVAGTLTTPVALPVPGAVAAPDKGGVGLADGPPGSAVADELAAALVSGGLRVRRYSSGPAMKWSKLLLNMLGNATSAVLGWPPERVFADRHLFDIERAAVREALGALAALGIRPVALPGYRVDLLAGAVSVLPVALLHPLARRGVAGARGGKLPGLATDMARGLARSEVEALNGAVARAAAAAGVPAPVNRALTELVCDLAAGRRDRAAYADRPDALLAAVRGANR